MKSVLAKVKLWHVFSHRMPKWCSTYLSVNYTNLAYMPSPQTILSNQFFSQAAHYSIIYLFKKKKKKMYLLFFFRKRMTPQTLGCVLSIEWWSVPISGHLLFRPITERVETDLWDWSENWYWQLVYWHMKNNSALKCFESFGEQTGKINWQAKQRHCNSLREVIFVI